MRCSYFFLTIAAAFSFSPHCFSQISLGQIDDFSSAGSAGWREGGASSNPPTRNAGAGFDGLAGHFQNISDGSGQGGRWLMWNDDSRWTGDYLAADVTSLVFDFDNVSGNGVDANVRVALGGLGGWFVSDAFNVADGSGWQTLSYDLLSLNHVAASGGTGILDDTLSSVNRLEILSAASTSNSNFFASGGNFLRGDQLVADFRVDNISAIPEPTSGIVLVLGALTASLSRRRGP